MLPKLFRTNTRTLRYLILPVLALTLTHLVSYRKLPFEAGYQFPWMIFSAVLLICAVCCEANFICYSQLKKRFTIHSFSRKDIFRQLIVSGILTGVVFGFLVYSINYFVFDSITPITRFLSALLMAELIILLETLYFITRDLYLHHQVQTTATKAPPVWKITSGRTTQMIDENDIAYLYSQSGMVYLVCQSGRKLLTQFNSLNEVKERYPMDSFFQINRQYLIKLSAVDTVMKEVNQKLRVKLSPTAPEIPEAAMISRYRSVDFKKWMAQ
ncbi:MAG: LytTR family transcriptional regulator DNA-binding domain-containing protein [Reichenbachiella sp.]|uniref:LytTR family DNA-binding domain-containing protein n=1 Tax=Reichenbachiella sp. TaxID=2184521 RepID=UPI00326612D1